MRNFILSFLFLCIPCLANAQDVQADVTSNMADWESTNHDDYSTDSKTYEFSAEKGDLLSFEWYVSSEDYSGELTITLDDNVIVLRSGVDGATYSQRLTAGSHTLIVTYYSYYSANNDHAGIRNIKIMDKNALGEYIDFADDNVWAICVENWDTNHDGVLSYSEAAAVTDFGTEFWFSEITSFDELQYFTGLTSIGKWAFQYCSGLTSVTIPNSVTSIDNYAFQFCSGLTSIEIPNSVTSIGSQTFWNCSSLTHIELPNSVTSIGTQAFYGCSNLTSIEIPNSVTSIGIEAFIECNNLWDIYCYAETVPSMEYINHYGDETTMEPSISIHYYATLHVPACAIDDYKNTEPWSSCFSDIVPIDPMEFDLTVSDAGIATLYLDYSVAIPEVEGMGDVMYVSDVVGRTLVLTKVENNIPAHTGVIVYAQPGTYTLTSSTTHVDACENSRLSGVTQDTPTANIDGTVYTLSVGKNPEDIGFRKFVGGTLAANKAFLVMNESSEVNFYNFGFDDELTGISTTVQNVDDESAIIYDLQGRRVTSPTKGIYIVNGQKRIINHR